MPHEKRAPLGYFEYPLNDACRHENTNLETLYSVGTDSLSDWSSQLSSKPSVYQSSAHTTPDSTISFHQPNPPVEPYSRPLQGYAQLVNVPAWREGVEEEKEKKRNLAPVVPPSQRQHPRRTAPACRRPDSMHISPPPTLVRQPEKKHCFVSSLVIFAAGLIAAIWPLSAPVLHDTTYAHNVLPLQDFITETLRRSKTSYSTLQVAMFYLILLKDHLPRCDFTQDQSCISGDRRVMQCGRRMFLSALMLASKFLQDRNYSTRAWGKITGLPASEINANELKFLEAVEWKLHVGKEKFERWSHTVIALSAPPRPGLSPVPQPSLVETLGWSDVLDRLTADCREDFSHLGASPSLPRNVFSTTDAHGMLTPPSSPPDSTGGEQDDPSHRPEVKYMPLDTQSTGQSGAPYPAPPPPPHQQNLPTPRGTPGLARCPSLSLRAGRAPPRCPESSSAMSMLKLCARPANRALCPPPPQRRYQTSDQSTQSSATRRCSISSSSSGPSSPESQRSEVSDFRSRSSSVSSVASSGAPLYRCTRIAEAVPHDPGQNDDSQCHGDPPKADCSSALRSEDYGAADALLRFHTVAQGVSAQGVSAQGVSAQGVSAQGVSNQDEARSSRQDVTTPELIKDTKQSTLRPNRALGSADKQKKKRTHSKTNIADLTVQGPDLHTLVRQDLMNSCEMAPGMVIPDVDVRDAAGRPCKRNRSGKDQLSAVDFARILLKERQRASGSHSVKCHAGSDKGDGAKSARHGSRIRAQYSLP